MSTPDIPGDLVPSQSPQETYLKRTVSRLCGIDHDRFPGAQPVSFGTRDLQKLELQDYWVCEKSDGIRVLFFILTDLSTSAQDIFLIDRHNKYRALTGLFFPHYENFAAPLRSTIVDGELVIDIDPVTKRETMSFLAFDCLVVDEQNIMSRQLDKRYGRLTEWFYKPYSQMIRDHPHMRSKAPFDLKVKEIRSSYNVEQVFNLDIPALHHGNDGLIYTCVSTPYACGTDPNIMKWKPPSENSVDFKLILRFPPLTANPAKPDFHAKPKFLLHVWCGSAKYEQYDELYVDDNEWEDMKLSGEQYDERIIEVHWDFNVSGWRMMRFRDDKPHGNHRNVVENIIQSIADGVEKEALLARSTAIRTAWKARMVRPAAPQGSSSGNSNPAVSRNEPSKLRFGPLASSPWSKVSGPAEFAGMIR